MESPCRSDYCSLASSPASLENEHERNDDDQELRERELSALNARVDALSLRDADQWDEAVDWGVTDVATTCPLEWRISSAPEFD